MCGIAGFYGFRDDKLISNISQELKHRGPDGEGYYLNEKVTLLNRRLAIIDRKGGDQPIYNEDHSLVVVYNGEIYDFKELRIELEKKGHKFSTKTDTEVIVHGFEEWRENCFDKLNGMFAIALYDLKNDKLILARDHFGIKPLYYSIINDELIFSSEIKPILNSGLIKKEPNDKIIYRYLKFRIHDEGKETFFKNIFRLLPGEMLIMQDGICQVKKYTHLEEELATHKVNNKNLGNDEIETFKKLFKEAVKMRLVSEVSVGTCLSGGLDSSSIAALVNNLLQEKASEAVSVGAKQKTFSAVFPMSKNDEERYIDEVIGKNKDIKSFKIYPQAKDFFQEMEEFIKIQEEPTISTGPYAQLKVMEHASKEVTVLLDGQGADEMMAGYVPYYFVYLSQLLKERRWTVLIKECLSSWDIICSFIYEKIQKTLKVKKTLSVDAVLDDKFAKDYGNEKFIVEKGNLKKRLLEDIFQNSLPSLLRYEDRNSMHYSLEGRVPFLDLNLIRYLFSLPDEAIIKNGWNKYLLRTAMKDFLPERITKRRNKIGFTTPESEWFKKNIAKIYPIFLSESFSKRKYFKQKQVIRAFWDFINGKTDDTMFFWRLINIEIWLTVFFDTPKKPSTDMKIKDKRDMAVILNGKKWERKLVKTEIIKKGDNLGEKLVSALKNVTAQSHGDGYSSNGVRSSLPIKSGSNNKSWFLVISEKIVAISQGRSYFIWEIFPGFWANFLSKHVKKTSAGIGLGSPWTMQLAINEAGLPRIIMGSILSILTKPFGLPGVFYYAAGTKINQIDGPTEYSLFPSNVSAKLGPKEPEKAARELTNYLKKHLPEEMKKDFQGAVIIDANDIGQNVLGNAANIDKKTIERIFADNPMGQGKEQTPMTIVYELPLQ